MNRIGISVLASVFAAQAAFAAGTPQQKCQSGKNQAVGKYTACRFKAEAKLALSGDMTKYNESLAKCDSKYASKWTALEQKAVDAGGSCPSSGDQTSIHAFTDTCNDAVTGALAGGSLPPPAPLLRTGQTLCFNTAGTVIACAGTGQDGKSLKGVARS